MNQDKDCILRKILFLLIKYKRVDIRNYHLKGE